MKVDLAILVFTGSGGAIVYLCSQPDDTWHSTVYVLLCLYVLMVSLRHVIKKNDA